MKNLQRYNLRMLLLVVTCIAGLFGHATHSLRRIRSDNARLHAFARITDVNTTKLARDGHVTEAAYRHDGVVLYTFEPLPVWLSLLDSWQGHDTTMHITEVQLAGPDIADVALLELSDVSSLKSVTIFATNIADEAIVTFCRESGVRCLCIGPLNRRVSDAAREVASQKSRIGGYMPKHLSPFIDGYRSGKIEWFHSKSALRGDS